MQGSTFSGYGAPRWDLLSPGPGGSPADCAVKSGPAICSGHRLQHRPRVLYWRCLAGVLSAIPLPRMPGQVSCMEELGSNWEELIYVCSSCSRQTPLAEAPPQPPPHPLPDRAFCALGPVLGPGSRLGFFWDILFLFYFCKVCIHRCSVATQYWGGTWKLPGQKM